MRWKTGSGKFPTNYFRWIVFLEKDNFFGEMYDKIKLSEKWRMEEVLEWKKSI